MKIGDNVKIMGTKYLYTTDQTLAESFGATLFKAGFRGRSGDPKEFIGQIGCITGLGILPYTKEKMAIVKLGSNEIMIAIRDLKPTTEPATRILKTRTPLFIIDETEEDL